MRAVQFNADPAYETWDAAVAEGLVTDEPDGLPDTGMVPVVNALRAVSVTTLQSCTGHAGTDDGTLWIKSESESVGTDIRDMADLDREPFERVQYVLHPEARWEFIWRPERFRDAIAAIIALHPRLGTLCAVCDLAGDVSPIVWAGSAYLCLYCGTTSLEPEPKRPATR